MEHDRRNDAAGFLARDTGRCLYPAAALAHRRECRGRIAGRPDLQAGESHWYRQVNESDCRNGNRLGLELMKLRSRVWAWASALLAELIEPDLLKPNGGPVTCVTMGAMLTGHLQS
jgi:hypothetical protein